MTTLLIAEHDNAHLRDATAKALAAATALGAPVHVLVAGLNARPAAEAAAKLDGVEKVLLADDAQYEQLTNKVAFHAERHRTPTVTSLLGRLI